MCEIDTHKSCTVDGTPCTVDIIDTIGQDEYRELLIDQIKASHVIIMTCSINSLSTFFRLDEMHALVQQAEKETMQNRPVIIAITKIDRENEFQFNHEFMKQHFSWISSLPIFETSAKVNKNITELIHEAVRLHRKNNIVKQIESVWPSKPAKQKNQCSTQ